ncbi:MAG: glycosyltransferase [Pyrobaculum sp.]
MSASRHGFIYVIIAFLVLTFSIATLPGGGPLGGYISDEVWYITAARNILHAFGVAPNSPFYTTVGQCLKGPPIYEMKHGNTTLYVALEVSCYVRRGFPYPKPETLTYYNLEHPPLAKYIYAAMIYIQDWPLFWRLAPMAAGLITLLLVYKKWGLLAAALLLTDRTFIAMSSIAMLDIWPALFTTLALYYYGSWKSYIFLGLAGASKYTGLFAAMAYWKKWHVAIPTALTIIAVSYIPLAITLGPWVYQAALESLRWHITPKPPGPVASSPADWLIMQNSFVLHPQVAATGSFTYFPALIYSLYAIAKRRDMAESAFFLSCYSGYWLIYAMGNTTLYSFYTAHFAPLAAIQTAKLLLSVELKHKVHSLFWRKFFNPLPKFRQLRLFFHKAVENLKRNTFGLRAVYRQDYGKLLNRLTSFCLKHKREKIQL